MGSHTHAVWPQCLSLNHTALEASGCSAKPKEAGEFARVRGRSSREQPRLLALGSEMHE